MGYCLFDWHILRDFLSLKAMEGILKEKIDQFKFLTILNIFMSREVIKIETVNMEKCVP